MHTHTHTYTHTHTHTITFTALYASLLEEAEAEEAEDALPGRCVCVSYI
jgi:hypothetical protein